MIETGYSSEVNVLGGLLVSRKLDEDFSRISAVIQPDDFENEVYRELFRTMKTLFQQKGSFSLATVHEEFMGNGTAARLGIDSKQVQVMLIELTQVMPTAANLEADAGVLLRDSKRRRLARLGQQLLEDAAGLTDPDKTAVSVRDQIDGILSEGQVSGVAKLEDVMLDFLDRRAAIELGERVVVPSGIEPLDDLLSGGFRRGEFVVLGARPGVGKSIIAANVALNVAASGKAVLFCTIEMTQEEVAARLLSRVSWINNTVISLASHYTDEQWGNIANSISDMNSLPLYIDDGPDNSPTSIESKARKIENLGLVVIDYLQLLTSESGKTLYEQTTFLSKEIRKMAKRLNVPILCLSQLSRSGASGIPSLEHLRESGAIEQDASTVILVSRGEGYDGSDPVDGIVLDVAKHRGGKTGKVEVWIDKAHSTVKPPDLEAS